MHYGKHYSSVPMINQNPERTNLRKIFEIRIGNDSFDCLMDTNGHSGIKIQTEERQAEYKTLGDLLTDFPELKAENNKVKLAEITNFLLKGERYSVITEPKKFIENYLKVIEAEGELFELPLNAITRHGVYNVEEIQLPRHENGQFIFYVKSANIPYRVTLSIPMQENYPPKYELLPQ